MRNLSNKEKQELLKILSEDMGFESVMDMLEAATFDSVAASICTECKEYSTEMEPDQTEGWCELCESNTVVSCLILAGII